MTAAHRRSLAPLLPEEDTVILLTEKNNTIHHLLLSLPPASPPSLCIILCSYEFVFVPPKVPNALKILRSDSPQKLIQSNPWLEGSPEGVIYLDETP